MTRPKMYQKPARMNLIIEESVKASAVLMAAERGLSVGQLVSQLIQREVDIGGVRTRHNGKSTMTPAKVLRN